MALRGMGSGNEEYKVLDMSQNGRTMGAPELESALNGLARQGWKVRATTNGNYLIILAR